MHYARTGVEEVFAADSSLGRPDAWGFDACMEARSTVLSVKYVHSLFSHIQILSSCEKYGV